MNIPEDTKKAIIHPWQSGPNELIALAIHHLQNNSDFDRRVAFLLLDIGIETLLKTYLTLPVKITGAKTKFHERKNASESNFHSLLKGVETASPQLDGYDISHLQFYHDLRNKLYHQGNGITVSEQHVNGYAEIAVDLLKKLLDVDITTSIKVPEETLQAFKKHLQELNNSINHFQDQVELVIEKIEPNLLMPSTINKFRNLAFPLRTSKPQEDTYVEIISSSVRNEEIKDWLLNLIDPNENTTEDVAYENAEILFNMLSSNHISFYVLIVGSFVLSQNGILYSEENLTELEDYISSRHVLSLYKTAKHNLNFGKQFMENKSKYDKNKFISMIENGKTYISRLNSVSGVLQERLKNL